MPDVYFCCREKAALVFTLWNELDCIFCLSDALFRDLSTVKNGDEADWVFLCVPKVGWCPQQLNHSGDVSSAQNTDFLKLPGRRRAERGRCPCNCWSCFWLESVETDEDVTLAISVCDSSILWQTYGCKMGKATALPWELLFCGTFP